MYMKINTNAIREYHTAAAVSDRKVSLSVLQNAAPAVGDLSPFGEVITALSAGRELRFDLTLRFRIDGESAAMELPTLAASGSLSPMLVGDINSPGLATAMDVSLQSAFSRRESNALWKTSSNPARFGEVEVDFRKMELRRAGKLVEATAQEFKTLRYFLLRPEVVITRSELLNEVWGYEHYPTTRTVDNRIMRLRHKLEIRPSQPVHFLTVHGAGYKFVP
jgi:Transcriptional regulatory protein, C terminal